eukprot:jgi/Botrbrau1/11140/Bobra.331_1s0009.2
MCLSCMCLIYACLFWCVKSWVSYGLCRQAFPNMQKVMARTVAHLRDSGSVDGVVNMTRVLECEGMDVIGHVGFGTSMDGFESLKPGFQGLDKVALALACADELRKRLRNPFRKYFFWSKDVKDGKQVFATFHRAMRELLEQMREAEERGKLAPDCIAGRLLQLRDPSTGKPLHDDMIHSEFGAMFLAGFETMSHALAWVLYCVSQSPEVEAKLLAELASLGLLASSGNPNPRQVEWDDLPQLIYTDAVIKETLRMYPPVGQGTSREALKDVVLGGKYKIPKGTRVWLPIIPVQMSEALWENPTAFKPERFLQEGAELATQSPPSPNTPSTSYPGDLDDEARHSTGKKYMPFSDGPRNCVGMPLAKIAMTATLATVLAHFSFQLAPEMGGPEGVRRSEHFHTTLGVTGGMRFICRPRARVAPSSLGN